MEGTIAQTFYRYRKLRMTGTSAEQTTPLTTAITATSSLVQRIRSGRVVSSLVAAAGAIAV